MTEVETIAKHNNNDTCNVNENFFQSYAFILLLITCSFAKTNAKCDLLKFLSPGIEWFETKYLDKRSGAIIKVCVVIIFLHDFHTEKFENCYFVSRVDFIQDALQLWPRFYSVYCYTFTSWNVMVRI